MLDRISDYISEAMLKNKIIEASEKPLYKYALHLRIESIIGYLMLALNGKK